MAFRYLIYSTGTPYAGTIIRESATNNPGVNEASLNSDFVIPAIQPLYLWQVDDSDVIPNTDAKINLYEAAIAPAPTSEDSINYGEVTGITSTKIDKVTGVTGKIPVFNAGGNLQNSGYTPAELIASGSGVTTTTFNFYTGTTAPATFLGKTAFNTYSGTTVPNTYYSKIQINAYTGATNIVIGNKLDAADFNTFTSVTLPADYFNKTQISLYTGTTAPAQFANKALVELYTGTTAPNTYLSKTAFNTYSGTTIPNSYFNKTQISAYTGATDTLIGTKVAKVGAAVTDNIVSFAVGGEVKDSGKGFTTTVLGTGTASNNLVPTEMAVRNAINQAVAASIVLQGDWNATTNTPDLTVTGITTGNAWRVNVSGTTELGGISLWAVGDVAIKSATGWIRVVSQDIAAIWGNISGSISNQPDLVDALNAKLNVVDFETYSGVTNTLIGTKLNISTFTTYTDTTTPNTYYNKTQINAYTGATETEIGTKLDIDIFTGYTASTVNKNKKIQVVSTLTSNANVVTPLEITWNSASPYETDIYTFSGGSAVWIKSAGTYEVQYHILLKNDGSNQTHSVGANLLKNGVPELVGAGAGMVVGPNASGEISLPSAVLTLAVNDRLDLAVFRIGNTGNANLVSGSVFLVVNKLT